MAKKNYTKYNRQPVVMEEAVNETKISEEVMEEAVNETEIVKEVTKEHVEQAPIYKHGFVSGCIRLNMRKEPTIKSEVVCVIEQDTNLVITLNESTDDFYKVSTEAGIDGFCMKQYVTII